MTIQISASREEWLATKRKYLGSGDVGAVLGLDGSSSALTVYGQKRTGVDGAVDDHRDEELGRKVPERMKWGTRLQRAIAEGFAEETGALVVDLGEYTRVLRNDLPFFGATLDFYLPSLPRRDGPGVLEIKNLDKAVARDWRAGDPAPKLLAQVQHELLSTDGLAGAVDSWPVSSSDVWPPSTVPRRGGVVSVANAIAHGLMPLEGIAPCSWGILCALVGGNRMFTVSIERDEAFASSWLACASDLWERIQRGDPPAPDRSAAALATAKRLFEPDPASVLEIDPSFAAKALRRAELKAQAKEIEAEIRQLEADVILAGQTAETIIVPGWGRVTRKTVHRAGYDVAPSQYIDTRWKAGK